MEAPFPAYQGKDPFIFVCYAHEDARVVFPEMGRLYDAGFNIWYDDGISPGSEWSESIARHIQDCAAFVFFVTPRSVESEHCRMEVSFALDQACTILAVHLERTNVPPALKLSLSHRQAILKHELSGPEFAEKLRGALESTVAVAVSRPRRVEVKPNRIPVAFGSLGAFALIAGSLWLLAGRGDREQDLVGPPRVASEWFQPCSRTTEDPETTVAILPLQVRRGGGGQGHEGHSVANELWDRLAPVDSLRLISMRSSSQFSGHAADIRAVAKSLTARFVIDGFITSDAPGRTVSVHIIDAVSGSSIWHRQYSENLEDSGDVFGFYDRLASDIANGLRVAVRDEFGAYQRKQRHEPSMAAYTLVQRARYEALPIERSLELLDQAMEIDPDYDLAYSTKAYLLAGSAEFGFLPSREGFEQARELALRSLDLDPDNAEAYGVLGAVYDRIDLDFRKALQAYARAEELCALPDSLAWKQDTLLNAGLYEKGVEFTSWWEETNPTSSHARIYKARHLLRLGKESEAREKVAEALDLATPDELPVFANAFLFYFQTGELDRAEKILSALAAPSHILERGRGMLDLARGNPEPLRTSVNGWIRHRNTDYVSAATISDTWYLLGDYQEHMGWFKVRVRERAILGWIKDFTAFQNPDYFERLNEWALSEPEYIRERVALVSEHRDLISRVTRRMVP